MKKWKALTLVGSILLMGLTGCGQSQSSSAGTSSGSSTTASSSEITVYTAIEDDQLKAYMDGFSKAHPEIKVNLVRDSTGVIVAKLIAEKDNPQADVVWNTAATELLVADQLGMLEPYSPKGIERIKPEFKDTREPAHWVGANVFETAIVVNTVELEKRNLPIPESYQDLIKPEYKGLIVMPNPASSGTGYFTVGAFIELMGEERAWKYMDQLHENIAIYTHSGSKPAKMAATGEYPIGISFGYRAVTEKKKGAPLEVVFPAEGSGWDIETNALVKKPNIKPEAKTFLDWANSEEAMKLYGQNFAIISAEGVEHPIPEEYPTDPASLLVKNDLNKSAENRKGILSEWEKRFGQKSEPKK